MTGTDLSVRIWCMIATHMTSHELPLYLNTLLRHQVFADPELVANIADRIDEPAEVRRERRLPYHYFTAISIWTTEYHKG